MIYLKYYYNNTNIFMAKGDGHKKEKKKPKKVKK